MSMLSRRGFLGLAGGVGAASLLAACGGGDGGASADTVTAIVPSTAPPGWQDVLAKVNAGLKKDTGLTVNVQFVNWSNYKEQSLLKFTAGERFDSALQALWLNMAQLQKSGALADLTGKLDKYPNLSKALAPKLIESNTWEGKLWGIPQVNSAARVGHFAVRQDLAESYGFAEITGYDTLERFFYAVKQKGGGVIPFAAASNTTNLLAVPTPVANFNAASWDDPHTIALAFTGKGLFFIPARDAARTGAARPVPFWEDDGVVETFHRIRKYYNDGIINRDALNTDSATITSQWQAGKYASVWAITDGTASNALPALREAVPGARMANVMPFKDGLTAKPNQTFQADNLVVVPAKGSNTDHALALQDWLSVKVNHDLLAYGIEGRDWKAVGEDKYEGLSKYNAAPGFPGYALCWRAGMERQAAYQSESEAEIFAWAQNYDNFTPDPFASFIPDVAPVESAVAQMTSVITEYANPLYYGVVDVDPQLDKLKKAAEGAGLASIQEEMEKQANAYLAKS